MRRYVRKYVSRMRGSFNSGTIRPSFGACALSAASIKRSTHAIAAFSSSRAMNAAISTRSSRASADHSTVTTDAADLHGGGFPNGIRRETALVIRSPGAGSDFTFHVLPIPELVEVLRRHD